MSAGFDSTAAEQPDWDVLRARMATTSWSTPAREAGLWALDTLQKQLGPRWPRAWKSPGQPPPELAMCWCSLPAFSATLDLALGLHLLNDVSGIRAVRDTLRSTGQAQQLASPRLQVRMASLGLAVGATVVLEPTLAGASAPADLQLRRGQTTVGAELRAVLRDDATLRAGKWLDAVMIDMLLLGQKHGVDFAGEVEAPLDQAQTQEFLRLLSDAAARFASTSEMTEARIGGVRLHIVPADGPGGGQQIKLPPVAVGARLAAKIATKATTQTRKNRAGWLVIDSFDHLWHLSQIAALPFPEKLRQLVGFLRPLFRDADHLRGVVCSDGGALTRPGAPEQTVELGGAAVGLSRRRDYLHLRESIVLPLAPASSNEAELWRDMLEAETQWLSSALDHVGLQAPPELVIGTARLG